MIVTLTANPSIDRTVSLNAPLRRGAVHRATSATSYPGGKGVNVARVITEAGINHCGIGRLGTARVNLTITEPDGTTTKINEPGAALPSDCISALTGCLQNLATSAIWVVLAGSLPPSRAQHCRVPVTPTPKP